MLLLDSSSLSGLSSKGLVFQPIRGLQSSLITRLRCHSSLFEIALHAQTKACKTPQIFNRIKRTLLDVYFSVVCQLQRLWAITLIISHYIYMCSLYILIKKFDLCCRSRQTQRKYKSRQEQVFWAYFGNFTVLYLVTYMHVNH